MSLLNNLIAHFAPGAALRREAASRQYKILAGQDTRWRGASRVTRSLRSWVPGIGGPKRDLPETERKALIGRSRDAYRNHMVARAAITRGRTRIVGTGLRLHATVDYKALGISEDQGKELNTAIEREFRLWAENPRECDAESTLNFYQNQGLALVSSMMSGDVFALTPFAERNGCVYGLKIQMVEADRVSNPDGGANEDNLFDGVELDSLGAPVAINVQKTHPGDSSISADMNRWDRVPVFGSRTGMRRIMHVWNEKDRPGQVRGAPFLAPILEPLLQLEKYTEAELMAAVVSGMLTVFISRESEEGGGLKTWDDGNDESAATEDNELALGNGAVLDLAPGETPNLVNPSRPNTAFDPFVMSILTQIGASLEIPREELMLYYSSSYSAARAAMLQAWHWYVLRRYWLTVQFCRPLYLLFLEEAVARGRLTVQGFDDPARRAAYSRAMWIGPARGAIQELQEAKAASERISNGTSSIAMETAAMTGADWEEVHEQRVRERSARLEGDLENEQETESSDTEPTKQVNIDDGD